MAVADAEVSLLLTGNGDVLEPEDGLIGIGSGGPYRARRRAGADRRRRPDRRGDRAQGDDDRRRDLRLHQREHLTLEIIEPSMTALTPREIVSELDRFIVGQDAAKRAVAIALRNRWRRQQLDESAARGGAAQEHPDDRPDRLRQDRDRAPPGQARPGAVPQGRGDQVHRGRLCRPRRRDRSSATWSRSRSTHDPRAAAQGGRGQGRAQRRGARARRAGRRQCRPARPRDKFRRLLREGALAEREIELEVAGPRRRRAADLRHPGHAGRADGHAQSRRHVRQGVRRAHQAQEA